MCRVFTLEDIHDEFQLYTSNSYNDTNIKCLVQKIDTNIHTERVKANLTSESERKKIDFTVTM